MIIEGHLRKKGFAYIWPKKLGEPMSPDTPGSSGPRFCFQNRPALMKTGECFFHILKERNGFVKVLEVLVVIC